MAAIEFGHEKPSRHTCCWLKRRKMPRCRHPSVLLPHFLTDQPREATRSRSALHSAGVFERRWTDGSGARPLERRAAASSH
jgi:hypothetical protein